MLLLKHRYFAPFMRESIDLQYTMLLLKLRENSAYLHFDIKFTIHDASIKTNLVGHLISIWTVFTIHDASIKTTPLVAHIKLMKRFTIHDASIKTYSCSYRSLFFYIFTIHDASIKTGKRVFNKEIK